MRQGRELLLRAASDAIETIVVKGTNLVPFVRPDPQDVVRKVNTLSNGQFNLEQPSQFFDPRLLVDVLDEVASDYTRSTQLIVTGSGGASGSLGLPGLALDVPVLVSAAVGLVRRHALAYGFTDIEEAKGDSAPLLVAFGAALGAEGAIARVTTRIAAGATGETMERLLARVVSEELAAKLVASWIPRAVPVISSVTSAALDYLFLREVGRRSARYFRRRHLLVRRQLAASAPPPPALGPGE